MKPVDSASTYIDTEAGHNQPEIAATAVMVDASGPFAADAVGPQSPMISRRDDMITLSWDRLTYITLDQEKQQKTIIHPMSGEARPGEMLAIMGTSGAGKSTLLDIIAGARSICPSQPYALDF